MKLADVLTKLHPTYKDYVVTALNRAIALNNNLPEIPSGKDPRLDDGFNLLGRAITRRDILKDIQDKVNYNIGSTYIPLRIDEIQAYIENCEKEIKLLNEMIRIILMKEVPNVTRNSSEGVDGFNPVCTGN
jgi:hypothetical protein